MTHYGNSWGRIALPGGACPLPPSCHQCERYGMLLERQDARTREWRLTEDSNNGVTLRGADYCAGARRSAPRSSPGATSRTARAGQQRVAASDTLVGDQRRRGSPLLPRTDSEATHQVFGQYCKLAAGEGAASSHLKRQPRRSAAMHGLQHIAFDSMPHISDLFLPGCLSLALLPFPSGP